MHGWSTLQLGRWYWIKNCSNVFIFFAYDSSTNNGFISILLRMRCQWNIKRANTKLNNTSEDWIRALNMGLLARWSNAWFWQKQYIIQVILPHQIYIYIYIYSKIIFSLDYAFCTESIIFINHASHCVELIY